MKRVFSLLIICVFCTGVALATSSHATIVPVKWFHHQHRDPRVKPHHAHKAGKHHTPKRDRHHAV